MEFETTRFGTIEIPDEEIVSMPRGFLGLEHFKRYALIPHRVQPSPFLWFQSLEDKDIAFVVCSPLSVVPDYEPDIPDAVLTQLDAGAQDKVAVFNVVNFAEEGKRCFVNLCAPIVLNLRNRSAVQIVLDEKHYPLRHELFASEAKR